MSRIETHLTPSGAVHPGALQSGAMHSGAMTPPGTRPASFDAWQALVAPGDVFRHPREVLSHPLLSRGDKRAILASWASDACAVENAPGLRCLTGSRAEPVSVDTVLTALAALDREPPTGPPKRETRTTARRLLNLRRFVHPGRRNDDDDDPPPCPAAAMPRPPTPPSAAALALRVPA